MKAVFKFLLFVPCFMVCLYGRSQVLPFSSLPGSPATLYLDFDGEQVTGTSWNWDGAIQAKPSTLSTDAIQEIVHRVAEDFSPFELNVTTSFSEYNKASVYKRLRIIITPTHHWYGEAGGVSFVGSFNWGDGTPAFVFENVLGKHIKYIAETISHEAGHAMGLHHQSIYNEDCSKLVDYNGGSGTGETGWAPIMGVGYYKNLTTWHIGKNTLNCNTYQNDIDLIANATGGLRSDDYGNDGEQASPLLMPSSVIHKNGLINDALDKDVFKLEVNELSVFKLKAIPEHTGNYHEGANLDIQLSLLNEKGELIRHFNPLSTLDAAIDTMLVKGNYYIVVDGVGNSYSSDAGMMGRYTLKGNLASYLSSFVLSLKGSRKHNGHQLQWNSTETGLPIQYELQVSKDGLRFEPIAERIMNTAQYFHATTDQAPIWYRMKGVIAGKEMVYSNMVSFKEEGLPFNGVNYDPQLQQLQIRSNGIYWYQLLDASGRILSKGAFQKGQYLLPLPAVNGLMLLHWQDGNGMHTYKFIKH